MYWFMISLLGLWIWVLQADTFVVDLLMYFRTGYGIIAYALIATGQIAAASLIAYKIWYAHSGCL